MLATSIRAFTSGFAPEAVWLVACSGGQDSVVLVDACAKGGIAFAIAHVNYHLRGTESDGDEAFVRALASTHQVPCHVLSTQIDKKAGLQEEARRQRYAFFTQTCVENGYEGTLVAHHAQDQAETILHNIVRGTGLKGLGGMRGWNPQMRVGRPLLQITKEDIIQYAQTQNLAWREDSSNSTVDYTRNRIRHVLLPVLTLVEPDWQQNLLNTATEAQEAWAEVQLGTLQPDSWPKELPLEPTQNRITRAQTIVAAYPGIGSKMAIRLASASQDPTSPERTLVTGWGTFRAQPHLLTFSSEEKRNPIHTASQPLTISLAPTQAPASLAEIRAQAAKGIYYLSAEAAPPSYILRPPQEGDRIQPLGMQGTRLLSDIRTDMVLPPSAMQDVRVLVREDGTLLWTSLGIVSELAKCTPNGQALRIECKKSQ